LFSYLSKLNKKLQANQGHQRWAATQIFQIRFSLVYLGLLKGDKSDSTKFRMVIFGFLLLLLFVVPRYKLSLCHTPIKPHLLGFPGIGVCACGLHNHMIMRFTSFGIRAWLH